MNACMYETGTIYSTENALYDRYEKQSGSSYNRKCIDGKITGCGSCVGYCQFTGHPGFLTSRHREEHDCINKQCRYYLPKPKRNKTPECRCDDTSERLLTAAQAKAADMEGLRILKAAEGTDGWILSYITISDGYSLDMVAVEIKKELGISVSFAKLNYNFDICVQLLLAV